MFSDFLVNLQQFISLIFCKLLYGSLVIFNNALSHFLSCSLMLSVMSFVYSPLLSFQIPLPALVCLEMDSVDSAPFEAAIRSRGVQLSQHEEQLNSICHGLQEINARHEGVQNSVHSQVSNLTCQIRILQT